MLPKPAMDHKALLTLNTHEMPMYKDALPGVPGVDTGIPEFPFHDG